MLLVDTKEKRIIQDVELKMQIAKSRPHSQWLTEEVEIVLSYLWETHIILTHINNGIISIVIENKQIIHQTLT